MASRKVNNAVLAYRKLARLEHDLQALESDIAQMVVGLDAGEMQDYIRMTAEIDAAVDMTAEASRVTFRAVIGKAGLDRKVVA